VRVLLVGAGGMLGSPVRRAAPSAIELVALHHGDLAVEDARAVAEAVRRERPDWIINCLARAARQTGARLLQISTDYVFDGMATRPYREDDPVGPLNVYGRTKLAGEQAVQDLLPQSHLIVRTQWLFGEGAPNFVATILRLARERSQLKVVNDQHGRPTYAADLAAALWTLIACDPRGTVHCANEGVATWFDLATAAVRAAGLRARVEPCGTSEMPRPAPRPQFSVLDCTRYASIARTPLRPWPEGLAEYLRRANP